MAWRWRWDAALRGLQVALVEAEDFGGATSSGCFKIVHGGLRYLQHLNLRRVLESVAEQQTLRQIAPHLIHPLPFLIPTYGKGRRGKAFLSCGLTVYDLLSITRNSEVSPSHKLPRFRTLSVEECLSYAPGISQRELSGGVLYYDCQMSNCERLTLGVARGAAHAGALLGNYLKAVGVRTARASAGEVVIERVTLRDVLGGEEFDVRARCVVNATGPWVNGVEKLVYPHRAQEPSEPVFSKGVQLVVPQFIDEVGLALESTFKDESAVLSRGGRSYFITPWRGYSLIGTTDSLYRGDPSKCTIDREEIESFIAELSTVYSHPSLGPKSVCHAWGGLRPLDSDERSESIADVGDAKVSRVDEVVDHGRSRIPAYERTVSNFISVTGVKYTTFRALAEEVVDLVGVKLGRQAGRSATRVTALPGGDIADFGAFVSGAVKRYENLLSQESVLSLARTYGAELDKVAALVEDDPSLGERVSRERETIRAEIVHVSRREMVGRLRDVVMRRTGLGTVGFPGEEVMRAVGELVGRELGWNGERITEEVQDTTSVFSGIK